MPLSIPEFKAAAQVHRRKVTTYGHTDVGVEAYM